VTSPRSRSGAPPEAGMRPGSAGGRVGCATYGRHGEPRMPEGEGKDLSGGPLDGRG
jgi:hypothetical protein